MRISLDDLFLFCPFFLPVGEGLWKVNPEFYRPDEARLTQQAVYEILLLRGTRMHKADIIRIFKLKHPEIFGDERLFIARISRDTRIEAINKTGFWVLSEWNKETGTLSEVIERVLKDSNEPMNINDILNAVRRIVPCTESSIRRHLLHSGDKYKRLSKTVFDLASRPSIGDEDDSGN
jgi:hypothetical protein